jgi:hypothetical protein
VERLAEDAPTLVGIDHGFSFPVPYFEAHGLPRDWPAFLDDFQRHWPTDEDNTYVDFVREGVAGNGATRLGDARWRRLTDERAGRTKSLFHFDAPGSVAKATHAGLPWLRFIRQRLGGRVHFWPFDGWDIPAGRSAIADLRCFCDVPRGSACACCPEPQDGALDVDDMLHAQRNARSNCRPPPGSLLLQANASSRPASNVRRHRPSARHVAQSLRAYHCPSREADMPSVLNWPSRGEWLLSNPKSPLGRNASGFYHKADPPFAVLTVDFRSKTGTVRALQVTTPLSGL